MLFHTFSCFHLASFTFSEPLEKFKNIKNESAGEGVRIKCIPVDDPCEPSQDILALAKNTPAKRPDFFFFLNNGVNRIQKRWEIQQK